MPPAKSRYSTPSAPVTWAPCAPVATMAGALTPRATQRSRAARTVSSWICVAVMRRSVLRSRVNDYCADSKFTVDLCSYSPISSPPKTSGLTLVAGGADALQRELGGRAQHRRRGADALPGTALADAHGRDAAAWERRRAARADRRARRGGHQRARHRPRARVPARRRARWWRRPASARSRCWRCRWRRRSATSPGSSAARCCRATCTATSG